jgi:YidC/Oxa1 family membrane protein insertase
VEKRFVVFIILTMGILTAHVLIQARFAPPLPDPEVEPAPGLVDLPAADPEADSELTADSETPEVRVEDPAVPAPEDSPAPVPESPARRVTLGAYDESVASPLLVTLNSRGGSLERIELIERFAGGRLRYRNLEDRSGYLGHLALSAVAGKGCRVNVVGRGTPASLAKSIDVDAGRGLSVGDIITAAAGPSDGPELVDIREPRDLEDVLSATKPEETVRLKVLRSFDDEDAEIEVAFVASLTERPFQLIRPEPLEPDEFKPHPHSFLFSLKQLGDTKAGPGQAELRDLRSARDADWEVEMLGEPANGVEFRFKYLPGELQQFGINGAVELVKRYRLGAPRGDPSGDTLAPYALDLELEIRNLSDAPQQVAYHFQGPNGLPLEGWWFSNKIHPKMFRVAGARDIVVRTETRNQEMFSASSIYKDATKYPENPLTVLVAEDADEPGRTLRYVGVDTQYFLGALVPVSDPTVQVAEAMALGNLEGKTKRRMRTTNVTFQFDSPPLSIPPGESITQQFEFFAGPKRPELLAAYGLEETIYYGWFWWVARPLSIVLHFFYWLIGNFGIAIVMLTILVRSAMFPISRKAAKNAAMMQELAPELKKITEKYKQDRERRTKSQQELFKRHNYNPVGGCWLVFLQLPVFIGLYRCLAVDIELRQAALIPGIEWCSNLAGPDMLFYWGELTLFGLFSETGMLGPYFNILPLFTIALFLAQQTLFTPPATDDQTRMQLKMMKFMTLFIGVMFFKVASGLCLYFIASSLWGIAERKLLPKPKLKKAGELPPPDEKKKKQPSRSSSNGSSPKDAGKSRDNRRQAEGGRKKRGTKRR